MIFQATCKLGVEALVSTELKKLGIEPISVDSAKIRFEGDFLTMARACIWLRTAERVLVEIGSFEAHTFTERRLIGKAFFSAIRLYMLWAKARKASFFP